MKTLNYFHNLPYLHELLINYLFDPMHMFKNVSQIIWDHLNGKRDTIGCHPDLGKVNRMPHLWIDEDGKMPIAPWVLSKQERSVVRVVFEKFQMPMGTMQSMKGCFTMDGDLSRLKTHDWHKVLQVCHLDVALCYNMSWCTCTYLTLPCHIVYLANFSKWMFDKPGTQSNIQAWRINEVSFDAFPMIWRNKLTFILQILV